MIKSQNNPPNYFKELDSEVLEAFAKTVVNKFDEVPFEKISLFRYSHPWFDKPEYAAWFRYKYAIVFEIRNDKGLSGHPPYKIFKETIGHWPNGEPFTIDCWPEEQFALDHWSNEEQFAWLGADNYFPNVYKEKPGKDYKKEWIFLLKTIDEKMPIGVIEDDMHWVFYERTFYNLNLDKPCINDHAAFKRLDINFLKEYAKRVVTKFPKIPFDQIALFRYRNQQF